MRIESDESGNRVYVRQSWLNDALMCPERSRLLSAFPEMRRENDSAMMGTAVHKGIEAVLTGEVSGLNDMCYVALDWFTSKERELVEAGSGVFVTNTDPAKWHDHIQAMCGAWLQDIYPFLELGGIVEYKFCVPVASCDGPDGFSYTLYFEGTSDYVTGSGIWDWKTAARKYSEAEKQSRDIQSSVYTAAMVYGGMLDFPVQFRFGVMLRNASSSGLVYTVVRNERHAQWIVSQAASVVNSFLLYNKVLPDGSWARNDQHHLCSERWCPVWSKCKGALLGHEYA
jgi:hypothetical protein